MSQRTPLLIVIAAAILAAGALAVALVRCSARPAATKTPGALAVTTAPTDGATEEPATPTATSGPTPTFTKEEELVATSQHDSSQSASSPDECAEILKTELWCSVPKSAVRVTRPEWEELFPQTEFFVLKRDVYGGPHGPQQRNLLLIEHDGQRYKAETFDRLLAANGINDITEENYELVAKAFALITIPDYLEEEIVFTDWMEVEWTARRGYFDHGLIAWTKTQGLKILWGFKVQDGYLEEVERFGVSEYHVGDYIDVSFDVLPLPPAEGYEFWR